MKIIGFDIETIPQRGPLSRAQEDWLADKLEQAMSRASENESREEVRRKIMATSPFLGEIVCISLGEVNGSKMRTESIIGDEKEILEKFWKMIGNVSNGLYVSFNGLKFDVNFIALRSLHHKVKVTNKEFLNTSKFRKFPHFDVMQWMSDWGYPSPRLDIACDLAGVKSSKEGEIKAKDVAKAFNDGRIAEIAEYCEEDVRATIEVYLQVRNYVRD